MFLDYKKLVKFTSNRNYMLLNLPSQTTKLSNSVRTVASQAFTTSNRVNLFNLKNSRYTLADKRQYSSIKLNNPARRTLFCKLVNSTTQRQLSTTSVNMKVTQTFDNIVKSQKDNRAYRGVLLDNKLKCLLISDPTTDRSAASVDVHVG